MLPYSDSDSSRATVPPTRSLCQSIPSKNGCALISAAPLRPSRFVGSICSNYHQPATGTHNELEECAHVREKEQYLLTDGFSVLGHVRRPREGCRCTSHTVSAVIITPYMPILANTYWLVWTRMRCARRRIAVHVAQVSLLVSHHLQKSE